MSNDDDLHHNVICAIMSATKAALGLHPVKLVCRVQDTHLYILPLVYCCGTIAMRRD